MSKPQATRTVDPQEIARFNTLAETWWDPAGAMWPLHRLNALRAPFILENVKRHLTVSAGDTLPLQGLTVLDIGCGAGLLSEAMARQGAQVTGVDPAKRNIEIARHHAREQGLTIEYLEGTAEDLQGRQFEMVLNMEVVEHVENVAAFMRSCCALVKPGGMHFVATINRNPISFLVAIVGAEYVLRWLPRGTHHWRNFVKPGEAVGMLEQGGFSVAETRGVSVNPFTRRYNLTQSTRVNYMLVATKGL
ncbi:MAG: bifunctional 2-polyprenyl-6-hydroxyphenol methylase/3-demethylubiquinol 3-O-methyltransferase UbiG [Gammaproteobacteria bacterium]